MLLWPAMADADVTAIPKAQKLADEARMLMGSLLPPVTQIIPGYQPDESITQSLIVARFTQDVDDEMAWGESLSLMLRHRITYVPGVRLVVPGEGHAVRHVDAHLPEYKDEDIYQSLASLRTAGGRLGIRHALGGNITKRGDQFTIKVSLIDLQGGRDNQEKTFESSGRELAAALGNIALWAYDLLGVPLLAEESAYLQTPMPSNPEHLETFTRAVSLMQDRGPEAKTLLERINKQATDFPVAAWLWLSAPADPGRNVFTENESRKAIAALYPKDSGVQLQLVRGLLEDGRPALMEEKVDLLKSSVIAEPNRPMALLFLADMLKERGRSGQAVALSLEALRRWPDNYRVWWVLGDTLLEHAWFFRGTRDVRETPSEDMARYDGLRRLAITAIEMALSYNEHISHLWVLRIKSLGRYSPEVMKHFLHAVKLDPKNQDLYGAAMNFTAPAWGGDVDEQLKIYDLAVANNPVEEWPLEMANYFIPGYKWEIVLASMLNRQGCNSDCRDWLWIAALAVALLVTAMLWWHKYLMIFEGLLHIFRRGGGYHGPRKMQVDDSVLGSLLYQEDEQLWKASVRPDNSQVLFKIAGVAEPSTDLIAQAREIVTNYRDFKIKVVKFLFENSKQDERHAGEIRTLRVSEIGFFSLERSAEATISLTGTDPDKLWSCQYLDGTLHNLAPDGG